MKLLWRYVWNRMREVGEEVNKEGSRLVSASVSEQSWEDGINITVTNALGGKIVSFRRYDRKTDRSGNTVYVIPDDVDFNGALTKLITLESLRGTK